jgi:glycosyltransferase involved in cell wall biosynthesis
MSKPEIYFIVTIDFSVKAFLINHLKELSKFYKITVFVNTRDPYFLRKMGVKATVHPISISRKISILKDLYCLLYLFFIFLIKRPVAVHSLTPKAGLLAMLASFFARTPLRVHTFTGQVWITSEGAKKILLKLLDKFIYKIATNVIIDSHSQKNFLIKNKIVDKKKCLVFGRGSICGVDLNKFKPNKKNFKLMRRRLTIPNKAFVVLFLGRINIDKGVLDLAEAFNRINSKKLYLVFVGPDEDNLVNLIKTNCIKKINKIRFIKFTVQPNLFLSMANIICLPSYREGFPNVIIEAAAMGVPSVVSNIYGTKDTIVNKKSGLFHKKKSISSLINCLNYFLKNPKKYKEYSSFAIKRTRLYFDQKEITKYWIKFYKNNLYKNNKIINRGLQFLIKP